MWYVSASVSVCGGGGWISQAQDWDQGQAVLNMVMSLRVL
jgi:hypothetical protein